MVKLSRKSSWGGKRAGAGRKKNPNSIGALCEQANVSRYSLARLKTIREMAPDLAKQCNEDVMAKRKGGMTPIKAIRIIRKRLAKKGQVLVANSYDRKIAREQGLID